MVGKIVSVPIIFWMNLVAAEWQFKMPHYSNALTRSTVEIIEQFYMGRTNTLNFYHASKEFADENLERNYDTMNEILYQLRSKVVVQLEGYQDFKVTNRLRVYNIIFFDSFESIWSIFRIMTPIQFDYQGYYLLVLTTYSNEQYQIMTNIFETLWAAYITNVNIIWLAPQNDNEAIMYTYFPYTSFFCGKAVPIQLNQFRFEKWLHSTASFFPDKISNLHGCSLNVATVSSNAEPFMILEQRENGSIITNGIDGILLRVLSQQMNFSINLMQVESQGLIFSNGTATGALKLVIDNKANLTIGYIPTTVMRNLYMKSSYTYFTSNMVWMTPIPRLFSSLEKLHKPFKKFIWTAVLAVFLLSFIVIRFFRSQSNNVQNFIFGKGNTSPCLNISNIFFGGSLSKLPLRNFSRSLLGMFMIYCLVIRSSYQGALFNFMKSDSREPDIKNIQEMLDKNLTFYVIDSSEEFLLGQPKIIERTTYIQRHELPIIKKKLLDPDFKGALLSSEDHVAYGNAQVFPDLFFHYADEVFFVFNLCIYMHPQSCLVEKINQLILKFLSNGLMDSWVRIFVDSSHLKEHPVNGPKVLRIDQLLGSYELLAFGLLAGLVAFTLEFFSFRSPRLKRLVDYIN